MSDETSGGAGKFSPLIYLVAAAACFGLPYYVSEHRGHSADPHGADPHVAAAALAHDFHSAAAADHLGGPLNLPPPPSAAQPPAYGETPAPHYVEGQALADMSEVFRFETTIGWIAQRWPRISTAAGDLDLQGYRVPYTSGHRLDDVAGSLTYYFDQQHQCRRISFRGTAGDVRRFLATLDAGLGARPETAEPGVHRYRPTAPGVEGSIVVSPAEVLSSERPHERFRIQLDLARRPPPRRSF